MRLGRSTVGRQSGSERALAPHECPVSCAESRKAEYNSSMGRLRWSPLVRCLAVACVLGALVVISVFVASRDAGPLRTTAASALRSDRPAELLIREAPVSGVRRVSVTTEACRVRVLDAGTGLGIPGASLIVRSPDTGDEATPAIGLDATGEFPIADFDRELLARARGYFPGQATIPAGAREVELALHVSGTLRIAVLDASGSPIENARMSVTPASTGSWSAFWPCALPDTGVDARPLVTGADGGVETPELPCDVALEVRATSSRGEITAQVRIPSATRREVLALRVAGTSCLRGTIVWSDGSPARGVTVRCFDSGPTRDVPYRVRADGSFQLCGLTPGVQRWRIEVGGEISRRTWMDGQDVDAGRIVLEERHELIVRLVQGGELRHLPPACFKVAAFLDGREADIVPFHGDGTALMRMPTGAVDLHVTAVGAVIARAHVQVPCDPVEVRIADAVAGLRIVGAAQGPLTVTLVPVDPARAPTERNSPTARVLSSRMMPRFFSHDAADLLVAPLACGEFDVFLKFDDGDLFRAGSVVLRPGSMTVVPGARRTDYLIQGRARDRRGAPLPGVEFAIALASIPGQRRETRTDAQGEFVFAGVGAGEWVVFPAHTSGWSEHARRIVLPRDDPPPVEFVLPDPGSLRVQIDAEGGGVAGATVHVLRSGDGPDARAWTRITNVGGTATFERLLPGDYDVYTNLRVGGREYPDIERAVVSIREGERSDLRLGGESEFRQIRFTRRGQPIVDLAPGASLFTLGGWAPALPADDGSGDFVVRVRGGPTAVLLGAPLDLPLFDPSPITQVMTLAYVADLSAERACVIDIAGTDVVVDTGGTGCALPQMRLVSVGPFQGLSGFGDWCIAYRDEAPSVRRFADVPEGSVVELVSGPPGSALERRTLRVTCGPEQRILWPGPEDIVRAGR